MPCIKPMENGSHQQASGRPDPFHVTPRSQKAILRIVWVVRTLEDETGEEVDAKGLSFFTACAGQRGAGQRGASGFQTGIATARSSPSCDSSKRLREFQHSLGFPRSSQPQTMGPGHFHCQRQRAFPLIPNPYRFWPMLGACDERPGNFRLDFVVATRAGSRRGPSDGDWWRSCG